MNYDYIRTLITLLSITLICYFLTMINANFAYAYLVLIASGIIKNIVDKKEAAESIDELINELKSKIENKDMEDKKENPFKVIDEEDKDE